MGQLELKGTIIQDLDQVDEDMLMIFRAMLDTYLKVQTKKENSLLEDLDIDGNPTNLDELDEISDRMDKGEGILADEVYEKAEQWLKNTK